MEEIVIFGAGSGGRKIARILDDLGYTIRAYVDNDSRKWDSYIENIKIISPHAIKEQDSIVIASVYEESIQKQLENMGKGSQIRLKEEYINKYAEEHFNEIEEIATNYMYVQDRKTFVVESEIGLGHWGVEQYVRTLARILLQEDERVIIHTNMFEPYEFNKDIEKYIKYFRYYELNYWTAIKEIAKEIVKNLPCVIIDNWQNRTLTAAVLLKKIYPDKIKIMSMMHNDLIKLSHTIWYYRDYIDVIGAVSPDIINKYKCSFGIGENQKIFYKESPICIRTIQERCYELDKERPIRIAYGARIEKVQKRADLLLEVIDLLEEKQVNYCFDIAGTGTYYKELEREIKNRNLNKKIKLKGLLANDEMADYWNTHDLFISLSEFEGESLSMLEAMAEGCVPVITKVSGVKDIIECGENGYYVETDDIQQLVEKIVELEDDREKMVKMGENAKKKIEEKCSYKAFYNKFIEQFS